MPIERVLLVLGLRFVIKLLFAAAISLAAVSPAIAGEAVPHQFTRDGVTYVYTTAQRGDATVIRGKTRENGDRYSLEVSKGHVFGLYTGTHVYFAIPQQGSAASVAEAAL